MGRREETYVEFRYYEVPVGRYDLALLGDEWVREYGTDPLHFHNYLEIGYCYYGDGYMCFGEEKKSYHDGSVTVIPANFPHRTQGQVGGWKSGNICLWILTAYWIGFMGTIRFLRNSLREILCIPHTWSGNRKPRGWRLS